MLISLLVSVTSYQYGPDLVVVHANEAFYALVQGVLVNNLFCSFVHRLPSSGCKLTRAQRREAQG